MTTTDIYLVISDAGISVHYSEAAAVSRAEYVASKHSDPVRVLAFDMATARHIVTVQEEVAA